MYGPDLCVMANVTGHTCYVINFHLEHLSGGTIDTSFNDAVTAFVRKYARALRSRWVQTSVTAVFLSGSRRLRKIAGSRIGQLLRLATRLG